MATAEAQAIDYQTLLEDSVRRFPPERFRRLPAIPVFAAHQTRLRSGEAVHYTPEVLETIAGNCNRRIAETGNWAAVCIGHTEGPHTGERPQPLIGFAGPFRVDQIDGRAVIIADLWIYAEDAEKLKYYPRPSPEVWIPRDGFDPQRIFLDPIAMLGAETPRLDLGMSFLYSAKYAGGWQCEKYAVHPGATSVVVPGFGEVGNERDKLQRGEPDMLTGEDIQAIIRAIEATDWYQWVRQQMAASTATTAGSEGGTAGAGQGAGVTNTYVERPGKTRQEYQREMEDQQQRKRMEQAEPIDDDEDDEDDNEDYRCGTRGKYAAAEHEELQREVYRLKQALVAEYGRRVNAERRRHLEALRRYYALDVDEEMEACAYGKMDDQQFVKHMQRIEKYYRPLPSDARLPPWGEADLSYPIGPTKEVYQQRQAEELSEKARRLAVKMANRGQWISYDEACDRILAARTGKDAT